LYLICLFVRNLAEAIFGLGTGISDEDIRKVLAMKSSKSNKWEIKKQLDEANNCLNILKDTMSALHRGKSKFVFGAMEAEKSARNGWGRALKCAATLDDEKIALKERIKDLESHHTKAHENSNDLKSVLTATNEKLQAMETELGNYRAKVDEFENENIRASVALEVERARNNEMLRQLEA
jgi:chromosome segregation ATPase